MEIKKIENVFFLLQCAHLLWDFSIEPVPWRFQAETPRLWVKHRVGNPAAAVILDFQKFKILTFGPL